MQLSMVHVPRRRRREILSPPCPWCRERLQLKGHSTQRMVEKQCYRHFRPHLYKAMERPIYRGPFNQKWERAKNKMHRRLNAWAKHCYAAVLASRPKHVKLSPRELRRRQRLAGRNQAHKWKVLGGENQSAESKRLGGERAMHVRWHVKRGIVDPKCQLCSERRELAS